MRQFRLSMRWWLGLAFAAIAALTALSVAEVFNHRADIALRDRGQALAVGQSVGAAQSVSRAVRSGNLATAAPQIAQRHRLSVFVFSASGQLVSDPLSRGVAFRSIPGGTAALRTALSGERYVDSVGQGKAFVVGLRLTSRPGGAVVTYTPRPDLRQELGIVQSEVVRSAVIAVALAALVGLLVASLIAARLRRIARAAAAIEAGDFDRTLQVRFRDEVGSLATTVDQMRTRLRESFENLETERDHLHRVLDSLDQGVIAVNQDLAITYANEPARELFGRGALELPLLLTGSTPEFSLPTFASDLFEGELHRVVHARVTRRGRTYALAGIAAADGNRDAILVIRDVSERERRERAEREFVTNAAHELGTPVAAITASLEALQAGALESVDERDRFIGLIERQTARLVRLRRALLMLARAQTGQESLDLEPVQLQPLLRETARLSADIDPLMDLPSVVVECDPELVVLARPELLEQIIVSVTENALRHGKARRIELRATAVASGVVSLEIRDDGIGISRDVHDRLFDRFFQAGDQPGGFGLGLAIVRELVRALGGTVSLDSEPGEGTIVRISLTAPVETWVS